MDISTTIEVDSTQVNADDFLAAPRTVTITGVKLVGGDQPLNIELAEFPGRVYRPCKSMRRIIVEAWGSEDSVYVGRRLTLYNDPTVKWGGQTVGGIRIKAMSHIKSRLTARLTVTRGKKGLFTVEPLPEANPGRDGGNDVGEGAEPSSGATGITPPRDQDSGWVAEFETRIVAAETPQQLATVAADLKASDLGSHHEHLLALYTERRNEISTAQEELALDDARDAD
jgi:hypothetical protein